MKQVLKKHVALNDWTIVIHVYRKKALTSWLKMNELSKKKIMEFSLNVNDTQNIKHVHHIFCCIPYVKRKHCNSWLNRAEIYFPYFLLNRSDICKSKKNCDFCSCFVVYNNIWMRRENAWIKWKMPREMFVLINFYIVKHDLKALRKLVNYYEQMTEISITHITWEFSFNR